ncbi:ATP-binding cassette domain-containing protein [Ascidiaceihabitans sp.]|nr:ATP-binding cassette domain-containing protein [Ascidiaceihabitans sp.]
MIGKTGETRWVSNAFADAKSDIIAVIFASSLSYILQIFIALFAMVVYNKIIPNNAFDTLKSITIGVLILIGSDFLFKILKNRIQEKQNRQLELGLSDRLYSKIIGWDLQSVPKLPASSSLLLRDVDTVVQLFGNTTINVVVGLPFIFVYVFVIYYVASQLAFVTLLSAAIALLINLSFFKLVQRASSDAKDALIEKSAAFIETLNNIEGIKSLGTYEHFVGKWRRVQKTNATQADKLNRYLSDATTLTGLVTSSAQIMILAYGAYLVFQGQISSGALIAAVLLHGRAQQPIQAAMQFLIRYSVAKTAIKRLNNVFNITSNEELRRENIKIKEVSKQVQFRDVEFTIGDIQRSILTVPKLNFLADQKVGILGSVGSGKSTFVKLLAGILTPTQGSITFGPYDTTAIDQSILRESVAYLGQQPSIFSGTIRENITLSKQDATDTEIEKALELSGFDKILKGFPNGLSYSLSEGGRELSGGQKQILALTRTLLSDPKIIVLDEPTSAMDPRHEHMFVRRMQQFTQGRSFFVVTHRRPILSLVDRIIVIENGKVVMDGPRDEILSKFS